METDPETVALQDDGPQPVASREQTEALLRRVRCPVLAIHGTRDRCEPMAMSERVAELTGGELLVLEGAGHLPMAREPVVVNHAIRCCGGRS
jgi:pimeloyl-ACP methyl ester carboxylesterase